MLLGQGHSMRRGRCMCRVAGSVRRFLHPSQYQYLTPKLPPKPLCTGRWPDYGALYASDPQVHPASATSLWTPCCSLQTLCIDMQNASAMT